MGRYSLQCADFTFVLNIAKPMDKQPPGYELVEVTEEFSGIEIEVEQQSSLIGPSYGSDIKLPPKVVLENQSLLISHPLYSGEYDMRRQKGNVVVAGYYTLLSYLRVIISVLIVDHGGLALHASCIRRNGQAYLFSGHSGVGKSTVIKLTSQPELYADEITLVRKNQEGTFFVHHSPFRSEFYAEPQQPTNQIAGLFLLKQSKVVKLDRLKPADALFAMIPNIFFPVLRNPCYEEKIINLCLDFLGQVTPYSLQFRKDNTFWRCIADECQLTV